MENENAIICSCTMLLTHNSFSQRTLLQLREQLPLNKPAAFALEEARNNCKECPLPSACHRALPATAVTVWLSVAAWERCRRAGLVALLAEANYCCRWEVW